MLRHSEHILFGLLLLLTFAACGNDKAIRVRIDEYNKLSYHYRYLDIDSARFYALQAQRLSEDYPSGWACAQNNLAYVAYQQMYYDDALQLLQQVQNKSRDQLELLCADVMSMKLAQRIGQGKFFFHNRYNATRRIKRISEEAPTLPTAMQQRFYYALSEYHIVSATYYYYLGQEEQAIDEIDAVAPIMSLSLDTAQWLYYHYMLGSGGMIRGDWADVTLQEFDHLLRTLSVSTVRHYLYFRANALQSLATMIADGKRRTLLEAKRSNELAYLLSLPLSPDSTANDALSLAQSAYECFHACGDIFQSACAQRTLGELCFERGEYEAALTHYLQALDYVERQMQRSHQQLPQWKMSIRERISLTYSALGNEKSAAFNRSIYHHLLASTSQNYELQSRKEQLSDEIAASRRWLYMLMTILALVFLLAIYLFVRMRRRAAGHDLALQNVFVSPQYVAYQQAYERTLHALSDEQEEVEEQINLARLNLSRYRNANVERQTKVAMVYSIIPYLDRIIASVARMRRQGRVEQEILLYIRQLSDEIQRINSYLTDWIQMSRGEVKLHVTTFSLQDLFSVMRASSTVFDKQQLTLIVHDTDAKVKADQALTLFMINTLADNARKFTSAGGTVIISAETTAEYVEVSIADTGSGLSPEDVETLNVSKVYDPATLGGTAGKKGFGFGIMNCKGIIGKYRKTSDIFRHCDFGVESALGKGSRFWFRLPRVVVMLLLVFVPILAKASAMDFQPIDTIALMRELNDSAVAAQSRQDWVAYHRYNDYYIQLHHQLTADSSLPTYCERMQQLQEANAVTYALLVLSSFLLLLLFYVVLIRPRLSARRVHQHLLDVMQDYITAATAHLTDTSPLSLPHLSASFEQRLQSYQAWDMVRQQLLEKLLTDDQLLMQSRADLSASRDGLQRLRYEEDRLYVMNQILDNCLSTIKHETMYYPARTQQMADAMLQTNEAAEQLPELHEMLIYYRRVYTSLHEQAYRQLEEQTFHRTSLDAQSLQALLQTEVFNRIQRTNPDFNIDSLLDYQGNVLCDTDLFCSLVRLLITAVPEVKQVVLRTENMEGCVQFALRIKGVQLPCDDVFSFANGKHAYLLARQIIRLHDANCGLPGLRLEAYNVSDGHELIFTLKNCRLTATDTHD